MAPDRPLGGALVPTQANQTTLPALIADAGEDARRRFLEFFLVSIRNPNTRATYARAIGQFFAWCDACGLRLDEISPLVVAVRDRVKLPPNASSETPPSLPQEERQRWRQSFIR